MCSLRNTADVPTVVLSSQSTVCYAFVRLLYDRIYAAYMEEKGSVSFQSVVVLLPIMQFSPGQPLRKHEIKSAYL
jgi:hypothetical protein